jgi:hypothetical protein
MQNFCYPLFGKRVNEKYIYMFCHVPNNSYLDYEKFEKIPITNDTSVFPRLIDVSKPDYTMYTLDEEIKYNDNCNRNSTWRNFA